MSKKIFTYPNYSKGGVSAVLRGRASHDPEADYYALFANDRGGFGVYSGYSNIHPRLVNKSRRAAYCSHVSSEFDIEEVSVLSDPFTLPDWEGCKDAVFAYEFHSSDMNVIKRELNELDVSRVDEVRVPSQFMAERVSAVCSPRVSRKLAVVPNLVDSTVFGPSGDSGFFENDNSLGADDIPLVWVGRFDKGKGFTYFLRALALLPNNYFGLFVVSLESDPSRLVEFLTEAAALGVSSRVRLLSDVSPSMLSRIYRSARDRGGSLISTSLLESFGYSVAEAFACGLRVRAFDLPVWDEHSSFGDFGRRVKAGDIYELAESIRSI